MTTPELRPLAYEPAEVTLSKAAAVLAKFCPAHVVAPGIEPHCGEEAGGVQKPLPKTGDFPETKVIPILGKIS